MQIKLKHVIHLNPFFLQNYKENIYSVLLTNCIVFCKYKQIQFLTTLLIPTGKLLHIEEFPESYLNL